MSEPRGGRVIAATLVLASALAAGCASDPPLPAEQPAPRFTPPSVSLPEAQQALDAAVIPGYTVSIDKLDVRSNLIELGLNPDRTVQVPRLDQPGQLGHYRGSPRPGAVGPAALYGHVNGRVDGKATPGAFAKLDQLVRGDHIDVAAPEGLGSRTLRFEVYRVQSVPKETFPTAEVYGDVADPELRLITCGGEYDATSRNYLSNVIVYARLEA